jgi:hypothetical protein
MKFRHAAWLLLCVALVTLSCAKGDTGPTGPTGPAGSANVIYSDWYSPATWVAESEYGTAQRTYTMTDTLLTQEIVDRGVVLVYMRFVGLNPAIVQLPCTFADPAYSFSFRASAGTVKVVYYDIAAQTSTPPAIPSYNQVRYVLIPGGVIASAMQTNGSTHEQEFARLNSMSYSQVCRRYEISE